MKQRAMIRVTWEAISDLLGLPPGIDIIDVFSERQDRLNEQVEIKISGDTLPEKLEGLEIPWIPIGDVRE